MRALLPLMFTLIWAPLILPATAVAAPCCATAGSAGFERLAPYEDFAVGLRTGFARGLGGFDAQGNWSTQGDFHEDTGRADVYGIVRLSHAVTVGAYVPVVHISREAGPLSGSETGLGDVQIGGRFALRAPGLQAGPGLALIAALTSPTGTAVDEARDPLGADATGRGHWIPQIGLSAEQVWMPWFVRVDASLAWPLPATRGGIERGESPGLGAALLTGRELGAWSVAGGLRAQWTGERQLNEVAQDDSQTREVLALLGLTWRVVRRITLQAAVDLPIPIDGLGQNRWMAVSGTLGVRAGGAW